MRATLWVWIATLGLLLAGCPTGGDDDDGADDDGADDDGADDDGADDDGGDDDGGDDDGGDDDTDIPDPEWSCVANFSVVVSPVPPTPDDVLHVDITGDIGHVYVGLDGTAPNGNPVSATLDDVTGKGPWTWLWIYAGIHEGRYDWTFTADDGATWLCDITIWVGPPAGDDDTGDDDGGDDDGGDDDGGDDDDSVPPPPSNPIGIGLVGPGNSTQWDRASELAGRGGHIKLIFPGMTLGMGGPPQEWIDATNAVYARQLVPVIRMGPPWGQMNIRDLSDDPGHMDYSSFAQSYANVVAGLPKLPGWPIVIEVHNETNLCYEWECDPGDGWLHYTTAAAEYAAFLRDVSRAASAAAAATPAASPPSPTCRRWRPRSRGSTPRWTASPPTATPPRVRAGASSAPTATVASACTTSRTRWPRWGSTSRSTSPKRAGPSTTPTASRRATAATATKSPSGPSRPTRTTGSATPRWRP